MSLLNEEMDYQYACSKWSVKKKSPTEVIDEFLHLTSTESDKVRGDIPHDRDVRYGDNTRQLYDIYGTDLPEDSGMVVFIHGGYWQSLSKDTAANMVRPLYNNGFKVIVADYDLCPIVRLEDIMKEISELIGHIVCGGMNTCGAVWLAGHSAGAHLASLYLQPQLQRHLTQRQRALVRGLILLSGVYDLRPLLGSSENVALSLDEASAEKCSTHEYFHVRNDCKILVAHGQAESPEFHRQSFNIYHAAVSAGTKCELFVVDNQDHFTIIEKLNDSSFELTTKIIQFITS